MRSRGNDGFSSSVAALASAATASSALRRRYHERWLRSLVQACVRPLDGEIGRRGPRAGRAARAESAVAASDCSAARPLMRMLASVVELCAMCIITSPESQVHRSL